MKKALLVAVGLLLMGASCPPTPPTPTPMPTPTPPVGYDTNRLLRVADGKLTLLDGTPFHLDMGVMCCGVEQSPPGVTTKWPLVSQSEMDYLVEKGGLNAVHMRLGPYTAEAESFVGVGNYLPGTQTFNPQYDELLLELVQHAYDKKLWVEVVPIDTWGCKFTQQGNEYNPWPAEDVAACGNHMTPVQEAHIRHYVALLHKFTNVIFSTDVEGALVKHPQRQWFEDVARIIREEDRATHLVGTNWPEIGDGPFDYVSVHDRAALAAPLFGKFTLNNERNPQFGVEQEISNFKQARALGLSYAFWRADMSIADMESVLAGYKEVISGGGVVGCYPPAEDDPLWATPPTPGGGEMRDAVNAAKAAVGEQCGRVDSSGSLHGGSLLTLDDLGKQLRLSGHCAARSTDSVFIKRPDGKYEEYHSVTFATGCWSQDPAQQPKNTWTYLGAVASACPDPQPPNLESWVVKIHNQGPNWTVVDATPFVRDTTYCNAIGFPGPRCPVRGEDDPHRADCEAISVGVPQWTGPGEVMPGNVFQYRVKRGVSGVATVCGKGNVCGSVTVEP